MPLGSNDTGDQVTSSNPSPSRGRAAAAVDNCAAETGRTANSRTDKIGSPARVGQVHRDRRHTDRRYPDPRPRRSRGMQTHPLPGKRQHRLGLLAGHAHRVQRRIQQHRMNPEAADFRSGVLRDSDLGEYFVPAPPHRPQTLKRRTVFIASRGQPRICVGHVHRRSPPPAARSTDPRAGSNEPVAQHTLGVQHPVRIRLRSRANTPTPRDGPTRRGAPTTT